MKEGPARKQTGKSLVWLVLAIGVLLVLGPTAGYLVAQDQDATLVQVSPYFARGTMPLDGEIIGKVIISGPPEPPAGFTRRTAALPEPREEAGINILPNVPAFNWSFGCSATSAAMIAGYYDRTAFPNMYTGPMNGGVMPMDNSSWPDWHDGSAWRHQCPLSATHNGLDGRSTNGHVDDYWVVYDHPGPDPFAGNWTEHTYGDCTGDFMKTNQAVYDNVDGGTTFWFDPSGAKYTGTDTDDGGYGLQLFYESRGYTVIDRYNRVLLGYDWDGPGSTDSPATQGATFEDYKTEIDAGRPVMVHLEGHTIVGVGYDDSTNTMYIHDTWDYNTYTMTWGGMYSGMLHFGITIVTLAEPGFQVDRSSLPVLEGGTNTFQVRLTAQPSSTVTASVSRVSGDSHIKVTSGSTLSFTTSNWNDYQTVTLAAAQDADTTSDSATVRIQRASGDSVHILPDKDVIATEIDNDGSQILFLDEPFDTISSGTWAYVHLPEHRASIVSGRLFINARDDWTMGCGVVTRDTFPNGTTVQFGVQVTYRFCVNGGQTIVYLRDGELLETYNLPTGPNYVALYASCNGDLYIKTSTGLIESVGHYSATVMEQIVFQFMPTQMVVTYGDVTKTFPLVLDDYHIWFGGHVHEAYYDDLLVTYDFGIDSPAVFRVDSEGRIFADSAIYGESFQTGAADVAEWVRVSAPVEPGDVLELDPNNPGQYRKSRGPCSDLVAGVVSTEPGFVLGTNPSTLGFGDWTDDSRPVTEDSGLWTGDSVLLALIGIVPVKVTDEGGPIQPGDLLVASSTSGHAMRWDPDADSPCALVGKALEPLTDEQGVILVLLTAH